MFLELGIVSVKFILKEKWANFLKYILNESKASTIRQVYEALKDDTSKGDFVSLVSQDLKDLKITMSEEAIQNCSKGKWKNIVKRQVKTAAFSYLKKKK